MRDNEVKQQSQTFQKSALGGENPILGTWKLQSLVFQATAIGQRSIPFGDHPVGYLSYSADGRMYADQMRDLLRRICTKEGQHNEQTHRQSRSR